MKILFLDLNGTCVDDWDASFAGVAAIFKEYKKKCPPIEEYIQAVAFNGGYREFYIARGIMASRDELYAIYKPAYWQYQSVIRLTPNLHTTLAVLREADVEIHLVTAASDDFAKPIVVMAGLEEYCNSFHYHSHDKTAQVRTIIDGMEYAQPEECVMIGDLPSDVRDAKRAGIKGVAFLNRHVPRQFFSGIVEMDFAVQELDGLVSFMLSPQDAS